jgi:SAM-dependent methyltransferase
MGRLLFRPSTLSASDSELAKILSPSPFVRKSAASFASVRGPVLDLAGGSGRHAFYLAKSGISVACLDIDLNPYFALQKRLANYPQLLSRVNSMMIDLANDHWPFASGTVGGIVMVDFLLMSMFPKITDALATGGLLLVQTIGNRGQNYLQLPTAGLLKDALSGNFEFLYYDERSAGPSGAGVVTVRLLARRMNATAADSARREVST